MSDKEKNTFQKLCSSFCGMFKRLFIRDKEELSVLEEEAIQTPGKTIYKNFLRTKLGVVGVIGFILVMLFSFVGSWICPMEETYTELTNANLRPGMNYLKVPKSIDGSDIKKIVSGASFSVALTNDGKVEIWGTECNQYHKGVSDYIMDIPQEVLDANIVDIATGGKHVLAVDDKNNFYGWGYYAHNQTEMPSMTKATFKSGVKIDQLIAATQWSAILGSNKRLYVWGSTQTTMNFAIPSKVQGHIEKVAAGDNNMILLLDDGTIRVIGDRGSEYAMNLPSVLTDGSIKVVDIASTNRNALAVTENGELYVWGNNQDGLNNVPQFDGKVVAVDAGYSYFTALLDNGEIATWGTNSLGQTTLPDSLDNVKVTKVFSDYHQNYAIDEEGEIHTWGNKGYIFGSDQYGRDILIRLIHGGRISLTVGAIAVVISTLLALVIGLISGFYGGIVDSVLMRLTDVVLSIPFLPLAITLSYVVGNSISQMNRIAMIMVIMGLLSWPGLARLIRAQLLLEREKDFVLAARALGIKQGQIIRKHILPNIFNLVIVNITLGYASSLLSEAGLSFLGFGVTEPTPSWGNMLQSAQQATVIEFYWWRWLIPGIFVVLAALFVNLIGDALREAMDPKSNEK